MSNRIVRSVPIIFFAAAAVVIAAGMTLAAKPGGGGCPRPRPNCVCPMVYGHLDDMHRGPGHSAGRLAVWSS